jgi:hypothetical protein
MQIVLVGCGSVSAVAKDKYRKAEQYLKDATVLERANDQLFKAKESRKVIQETVRKFRVDAEISSRQIKRLEDEKTKSLKAFKTVQDAAKTAGLPKEANATQEDKTKQIQIAGQTKSGAEIYLMLHKYKNEVKKVDATVTREQTKSNFLTDRALKVEGQLAKIDTNIEAMEQQIEDYKMYQNLLNANKTLENLNLGDNKLAQILDTDNIMSKLQKDNDVADITIQEFDKKGDSNEIKEIINSGEKKDSITDDDLI